MAVEAVVEEEVAVEAVVEEEVAVEAVVEEEVVVVVWEVSYCKCLLVLNYRA